MAWGLDSLRRELRAKRAGFGETRDLVWHRLVPNTYRYGAAELACTRQRAAMRRTAGDMATKEITCPACRGTESESNDVG